MKWFLFRIQCVHLMRLFVIPKQQKDKKKRKIFQQCFNFIIVVNNNSSSLFAFIFNLFVVARFLIKSTFWFYFLNVFPLSFSHSWFPFNSFLSFLAVFYSHSNGEYGVFAATRNSVWIHYGFGRRCSRCCHIASFAKPSVQREYWMFYVHWIGVHGLFSHLAQDFSCAMFRFFPLSLYIILRVFLLRRRRCRRFFVHSLLLCVCCIFVIAVCAFLVIRFPSARFSLQGENVNAILPHKKP